MDNKCETFLVSHIWKNMVTGEDKQYHNNTHAMYWHNFAIFICEIFIFLYTVNDLFSAQCAKERLFLVNILVEKFPF